ncbi:hypothetical protein IWX90DRAFT_257188 [Phyllosticta citrichinensis]|uniref:Uncharacterized protein n=1 Tax=Phyllosticta citrichinensis TaxID=1130410 RepID=A0ABR1XS14_9PEZI
MGIPLGRRFLLDASISRRQTSLATIHVHAPSLHAPPPHQERGNESGKLRATWCERCGASPRFLVLGFSRDRFRNRSLPPFRLTCICVPGLRVGGRVAQTSDPSPAGQPTTRISATIPRPDRPTAPSSPPQSSHLGTGPACMHTCMHVIPAPSPAAAAAAAAADATPAAASGERKESKHVASYRLWTPLALSLSGIDYFLLYRRRAAAAAKRLCDTLRKAQPKELDAVAGASAAAD